MRTTINGRSKIQPPTSRTPQNRKRQSTSPNLQHIKKLQTLRKNDKLSINENNMKNINTSLALEQVSKKKYQKRQAQDNLFLRYTHNPFLVRQTNPTEPVIIDDRKMPKKELNLIEALNNIKKTLSPYTFDKKKTCGKVLMDMHQHQRSNRSKFAQNLHKKQNHRENRNQIPEKQNDLCPSLLQQELDQLDRLVDRDQRSYFKEEVNKKQINIFNVLKFPSMIEYGYDRLKKHQFQTVSYIKTSNSTHYNVQFEQISTQARKICLNSNNISKQDQRDQRGRVIDYGNISFEDMMKVAHGKLTPSMLDFTVHRDDNLNDFQDYDDGDIAYRGNCEHKQNMKISEENDLDVREIQRFRAQPYTEKEQYQHNLSEEYMRKIEELLKREEKCRKNMVTDKKMVKNFDKQKQKWLTLQTMEYDPKQPEQRVRIGKQQKDRCQNIKNKIVLSTLIMKKVYEKGMRGESRQKMNMTTWR